MTYTGIYCRRMQAQHNVALNRITKCIHSIADTRYVMSLLAYCTQLQHIDSGKASRAEKLRHEINTWITYHENVKELELMKGLVIEVATMKARKAQRAARAAKTA